MSTVLSNAASTHEPTPPGITTQQKFLLAAGLVLLFIVALLMRLHTLGVQFDRDSYDEGVYWQTLRSLGAGYGLYKTTFYSQPPLFLLSVFPTYLLFGQTIWAARLGIALLSLLGLLGIFLAGFALRRWTGGFAALILLLLSPIYLSASQTLEAEGPQITYSILAVAFAYLWWENPNGWRGNLYAALSTLTLTLSLFSKLFAVATFVPITLLALAHIWRISKQPGDTRWRSARSLMVGLVVLIAVSVLIMLPYLNSLSAFWSQVVSFHNAAKVVSHQGGNLGLIARFLLSPLGAAALYGTVIACLKKDWRVIPLLAWAGVSALLLWQQQPLFQHHFVIIVPPLIALAVMGLGSLPRNKAQWMQRPTLLTGMSLLLMLITLALGAYQIRGNYNQLQAQDLTGSTRGSLRVAQDLRQAVAPDAFVITDGQFIAGLAARNTPPDLVDTSSVRINTHYVTGQQLIQSASQSKVQAVLFYTGRLTHPALADFRTWVKQHFREVHHYGNGSSLWVKI
ncbi:glycosyltransferase family 39 protein [Dictyobacter arantiisoli]|uniref:Glycosyltransferase RgtA/B/C/D-like domain-containing protein n=1 Tax=Dictyobacter arantiisoli TaxID=2014874 RepID=A0A5A5T8W1_9CHLR|nr:glycosyltransferase family 39 protein [Dictyobacter arantiisoli]GCF07473.1 hypothetical protein KDI_10370 [Dictyobacter arantiisoli]